MRDLFIDAGLNGLGVALFENKELVQAWYSPGPKRAIADRRGTFGRDGAGNLERGPKVWRGVALSIAWLNDDPRTVPDRVVMETMKVYEGRAGYGKDAGDLLQLAGVCGAVAMVFPSAELGGVLARDWKGQVPKPVMLERIKRWIFSRGWSSRVVVPETAPSLVHNAIDAAGLGLVTLGLEGNLKKDPFALRY